MAITIVEEIVTKSKALIAGLLPDFSQLDYEFDILKNSERGNVKGFGFIPLSADFIEGRSLGFTTMAHTFQIILLDDYQNYSNDSEQGQALNKLYENLHLVIQDFVGKKLSLPNPLYQVMLVRGLSFDEPEYLDDNKIVVLRANIQMQYKYKINC
jgi:hypothetical protein